jgi:hypothetical protein
VTLLPPHISHSLPDISWKAPLILMSNILLEKEGEKVLYFVLAVLTQ